jgi:hypothetical protein
VRTRLSRELPSYVEKLRFFAGVRAGASGAVGRDAQDAGNIGPTGGNISVGPYSSTAPPVDVGGLMIPVVFEFGSGSENRARRFEPAILSRMRSPADRSSCRRPRRHHKPRAGTPSLRATLLTPKNRGPDQWAPVIFSAITLSER